MGSEDTIVSVRKRQKFAGSKKARQHVHHKATGKYLRQKMRTANNKIRKLIKHLRKHPLDKCAQCALKSSQQIKAN